ncbi:hypothetical protein HAX54_053323, partial [Datura stramonium]|nr:hypothetical protein [Datura stramonium]
DITGHRGLQTRKELKFHLGEGKKRHLIFEEKNKFKEEDRVDWARPQLSFKKGTLNCGEPKYRIYKEKDDRMLRYLDKLWCPFLSCARPVVGANSAEDADSHGGATQGRRYMRFKTVRGEPQRTISTSGGQLLWYQSRCRAGGGQTSARIAEFHGVIRDEDAMPGLLRQIPHRLGRRIKEYFIMVYRDGDITPGLRGKSCTRLGRRTKSTL